MLLDGPQRVRAIDAVTAIGRALVDRPSAGYDLAAGDAGGSLFLAYAGAALGDEALTAAAEERLDRAIEAAVADPASVTLWRGVTGVGWVLTHLPGRVLAPSEGDPAAGMDELIMAWLERIPAGTSFEHMYGVTGIGAYALERAPSSFTDGAVARVIAALDAAAQRSDAGLTWFTPPGAIPYSMRHIFPDGEYNLGLAHGVTGVISFLARAPGDTAARLLQQSVSWLRAQRRPSPAPFHYPARISPARPDFDGSRLAWCYGDLDVAFALLAAARRLGIDAWRAEALELARSAAQVGAAAAQIADACFCHGSAGLGHMFGSLHRATGDEVLREAAIRWYQHALDVRLPEGGVAGFRRWDTTDPAAPVWADDAGLLMGAAGVGVALLSGCFDLSPEWERLFLLGLDF